MKRAGREYNCFGLFQSNRRYYNDDNNVTISRILMYVYLKILMTDRLRLQLLNPAIIISRSVDDTVDISFTKHSHVGEEAR